MADVQKFLNQTGVSTLWNQVVAKINAQIEANKYDDTAVKGDIAANATAIANEVTRAKAEEAKNATAAANAKSVADAAAAAIAVLQGSDTAISARAIAAAEVAKIVANADASFDTLKEIADWISTHASSATEMNSDIATNTKAIEDLAALVGSTAVATQIANAISNANLDQYALASELTSLTETYNTFVAKGVRPISQAEIDKLAKLVLTDGNLSISGSVDAGSVVGLSDAIDARIANQVVGLTTEEITAICK